MVDGQWVVFNPLFSFLPQDKNDTAPLVKELLEAHAEVSARWIRKIHTPPAHAAKYGEMLIAPRFNKYHNGRGEPGELLGRELEAGCPIAHALRDFLQIQERKTDEGFLLALFVGHEGVEPIEDFLFSYLVTEIIDHQRSERSRSTGVIFLLFDHVRIPQLF